MKPASSSRAVTTLILVFVSLFSSFAQDAALLNEMMAHFPEELLAAFGLNGVDLSTILGYFSLFTGAMDQQLEPRHT